MQDDAAKASQQREVMARHASALLAGSSLLRASFGSWSFGERAGRSSWLGRGRAGRVQLPAVLTPIQDTTGYCRIPHDGSACVGYLKRLEPL